MMRIAMMATTLVLGLTTPARAGPAPQRAIAERDTRCTSFIGKAIVAGTTAGIPQSCWQIGPLQLGMAEADVEHRIGKPVAETVMTGKLSTHLQSYKATLYAFPLGEMLVRTGHERLWLLELRYRSGRLAAIDNAPGARTNYNRCAAPARDRGMAVDIGSAVGPLSHFGMINVGDPLTVLRRTFGRTPSTNRSRDWYHYIPIPMSFVVDPDHNMIAGIAIATDWETLTSASMPTMDVKLDPKTCRPLSVSYSLPG